MAVRQGHVRDALGRVVPGDARLLEGRIALQEGVDQEDAAAGLEAEAGMSEPDDLHASPPGAIAPLRAAQYKDRVRDNNTK